jgi:hypothetical protein
VPALADLQLVEPVDPVVGLDLAVEREAAAELVEELDRRGLRAQRPEHVQAELAHVPRGAAGGEVPGVGPDRGDRGDEPSVLLLGERPGLRPGDPGYRADRDGLC